MTMTPINSIISQTPQPKVEVGEGATICHWSDRSPATVVEVLRFKSGARKGQVRGVVTQPDSYRLTSGSEQDGSAQYEYSRNPDAPRSTWLYSERYRRFTKQGAGSTGPRLAIGQRDRYYDPHF